jgi:hypothetical protein
LVGIELVYFKIADSKYNIIEPNSRSSHISITLRGGGIIFPIALVVSWFWDMFLGNNCSSYTCRHG